MTGFLIRLLRDVRLVPVVLIATIALFALKALGLVLDGGYLFDNQPDRRGGRDGTEITGTSAARKPAGSPGAEQPPAGRPSWGQQTFNFPGSTGAVGSPPGAARPDITGSVGATPSTPKEEAAPAKGEGSAAAKGEGAAPAKGEGAAKKPPQEPPPALNGTAVPLDIDHPVSQAERAILESLQKRRAELDARARELDVREDLLRAAEKRVGGRIDELKDLEARVSAIMQQKDEGEAARFKNIVSMYDNMKAKDAAKIFDGLDLKILLDVAKEINPRRMSDILAQMAPENAQRLTVELAVRSVQKEQPQAAELPKIQGKPNPN
jgi:flagellar motility protein MotE (MotC chaperone)